jgi:FeS assembly SUF system protein
MTTYPHPDSTSRVPDIDPVGADATAAPGGSGGAGEVAGDTAGEGDLRERVIEALRSVYDPEIPVNIYDLGLIYRVEVDEVAMVRIDMTLTAPGCPVAQTFPGMVENTVRCVPGVSDAAVELVWDPPWTMDNMSEAAKLQLGLL